MKEDYNNKIVESKIKDTFESNGKSINNKLLNTSIKRYLSILVFNMNARSYMFSSFSWDLILNVILNSVGFIVFSNLFKYSSSLNWLIEKHFLPKSLNDAPQ